jgi:hypothetical protein
MEEMKRQKEGDRGPGKEGGRAGQCTGKERSKGKTGLNVRVTEKLESKDTEAQKDHLAQSHLTVAGCEPGRRRSHKTTKEWPRHESR